ncbi:response regulator [Kovacikia minuta CCNUW1]|uniref:response regulator n=1 Tax=Kovacikia minuta TaxID=2931930 RepID=UPI001CCBEC3B|nr:response regulator [Kovacikia minuta]UBF24710.1 response regulator [Kovacikia minuta CCNUW1]
MNIVSLTSYNPPRRLHPLSLLAQITSRKTTGCLRVLNESTTWSIYLDQGELIYATSSVDPFERLDRHLRQLSRQVPTIVSAVRVQVRLMFENIPESQSNFSPDYRAICWLVEQQYLSSEQAVSLIGELAKEVIESFLLISEGNYEVIEREKFEQWIKLSQLDLRSLAEQCQSRLRQYQTTGKLPTLPGRKAESMPGNQPKLPQSPTAASNPTQSGYSPSATPGNGAKSKPGTEKLLKEKYTIVCVDDSPTVLQAIKAFLDDTSFSVVMVNDPVRALMQVIRSKPDLILMDVGMPNLDGYELCGLLRRNQAFKATPIIMVTGHTGFIDRAKAKLAGASGYLTKPFTQPELLKIVFKHLN